MVTRAALAFRPVLAFAYAFGAEGGESKPTRRLIGSSAQQRQQNAQRGSGLQRLNVWNALRRTGRTDDNHTVEAITAGMGSDQRNDWLRQQLGQTTQEMAAKGIALDSSKIGTAYFASPESPRRGAGVDYWQGKNHIEVNRDDARQLTVKELRAVMAREIAQTQPGLSLPPGSVESPSTATNHGAVVENLPNQAAALTYGAATLHSALQKMQPVQTPDAAPPDSMLNTTTRATLPEALTGDARRETRPQPQTQTRQSPLSR